MHTDILGKAPIGPWLVIGWFTEDYTSLARALSDNLNRLAIPHHLYARVLDPRGWLANTLRKPEVVLSAYGDHPGTTLILFDVDMEVLGDISELASMPGDVNTPSGTKRGDCLPWQRRKRRIHLSSRVMVWKSNDAARNLAALWLKECKKPGITYGDEVAFIEAYVTSERITLARIPPRLAGYQKHNAPKDALIVHDSEYDKRRKWYSKILAP
jgi:hypothetical protein